jgi:hypothetical protein
MTGPVKIIDEKGVYPSALDQAIIQEKLYKAGRLIMPKESVFVFGSNEAGIHGAGAARWAMDHRGAKMGVSFGPTGSCFAIPTKDASIKRTLPLYDIKEYVNAFIVFAQADKNNWYQVTRIGCGLAGLKDEHVAPLFNHAPRNCVFDTAWEPFMLQRHRFWGHFP